jgi:predicted  nucleic acid-binding Zn-ribbon protein
MAPEQADTLSRMLTSIGQRLNEFAKFIIDDRRGLQYSAGELRVQLQGANKEIVERKKQVEDLKARFSLGNEQNEEQARKIAILQDQLGSAKSELYRYKSDHDRVSENKNTQNELYARHIEVRIIDAFSCRGSLRASFRH